jgi:5'/3'-nucleotidase
MADPAPRILVTNDDGIHAPGLKVLEEIAREISDDVWVFAPESEQSGASHSLSLALPLRLREISERRYAVQGTPTDCVAMGLRHVLKDQQVDLVLSGVNRGLNISDDVTYSGTIAAAMEGTLLGVPSIALSQAVGAAGKNAKWSTARTHAPDLIRRLLTHRWPKDVLINVNFPDIPHDAVKGVDVTRQGHQDISELYIDQRTDARGIPYFWIGLRGAYGDPSADSDLIAIRNGYISVTPLHLDLTHDETYRALQSALE